MDTDWRPAGVLGDLLPGELNDGCCWACSGGGDVVCCDGCRAVYHLACINMESLPEDDFFCPLCSCKECGTACTDRHPAVGVLSETVPVHTRMLQPRQSPGSKLPGGPGYVCPQQLRLWLQQQPTAHLENGNTSSQQQQQQQAAAAPGYEQAEDKQAEPEPRPKRQKRDPVVSTSSTNSTPAAGAAAAAAADSAAADMIASSGDKYIRCCCCQRACHIKCLPPEQQQLMAAFQAATRQDSTDRDQAKAGRGAKRLRSPRGKKQPSKQQQEEEQQQEEQQRLSRPVPPFFCSPGCKQTATALAQRCALGAVQLDALPDGTPICWQLIQPAAVAAALAAGAAAPVSDAAAGPALDDADTAAEAPTTADAAGQSAAEARTALADAFAGANPPPAPVPASALLGTGTGPAYTQQQAHVLAQVLRDAQHLLAVQLGPVWEVRTFQHCLPWLLSGLRQPTPGGLLDLSHMHLAVLWVGSTLAAAALLRVHGGEGGGVLEVTLAGTTPQLQHRRLGRLLVGTVERFAMDACRVKQAWMPALGGVVKPCVGVSLLPGWERPDGVRGRLQLAPGCSTKLLGLNISAGSNPGAAAAASRGQAAEEAAQKVPKGVASCWALKLQFGRAANVTDWLQLTKCPLLRYSYVPFVSKRLEPQTMLPMPHFRKQQLARPPPLPPLPPQMPMQPRLPMPQMLPPPYAMQQQQQQQPPMMAPMQQAVPPQQQQEGMMTPAAPVQQQQQQQGVPQGPAAEVGAGAGPEGGQEPAHAQQAAAEASGQGPVAPGETAASSSQPEQQQQPVSAQQPLAAAAGATTAATEPAPQQEQQQAGTGQGNPAPAAPSKRQQWKEEMMRQFLAQQRAFAAPPQAQQPAAAAVRQQQPAATGAGDEKATPAAEGGPEPMQE